MRIKRTQQRIDKTGEIFTPRLLVEEILDKLPSSSFGDERKTFCDPACGDGNFLVEVLLRKLRNGHCPEVALSTIYGIDIMNDNVLRCRERLLEIAGDTIENKETVEKNIICGDALALYP